MPFSFVFILTIRPSLVFSSLCGSKFPFIVSFDLTDFLKTFPVARIWLEQILSAFLSKINLYFASIFEIFFHWVENSGWKFFSLSLSPLKMSLYVFWLPWFLMAGWSLFLYLFVCMVMCIFFLPLLNKFFLYHRFSAILTIMCLGLFIFNVYSAWDLLEFLELSVSNCVKFGHFYTLVLETQTFCGPACVRALRLSPGWSFPLCFILFSFCGLSSSSQDPLSSVSSGLLIPSREVSRQVLYFVFSAAPAPSVSPLTRLHPEQLQLLSVPLSVSSITSLSFLRLIFYWLIFLGVRGHISPLFCMSSKF